MSWKRRRYVWFASKQTGEVSVIDTFAIRLWKMRRAIKQWAGVMDMLSDELKVRKVFITLTYEGVDDYKPGQITEYIKALKRVLGTRPNLLYGFAWIAEMQERGAVHYHVILVVPSRVHVPTPDISGMWIHGMSQIQTARSAYYLLTYTGKEYQKDFERYPKSCRTYSVSYRLPEGRTKAFLKELRKNAKESQGEPSGQDWQYMGALFDGADHAVLQKIPGNSKI